LIAIAIFAAMFVVFLILLKYLTADKASQKDSRTVRPTVVKSLGQISNGQDIQGDFAVYFSII
jgi:preprotein translocase subunit SecG